jgi:hypothetical protein
MGGSTRVRGNHQLSWVGPRSCEQEKNLPLLHPLVLYYTGRAITTIYIFNGTFSSKNSERIVRTVVISEQCCCFCC